MPVANDSPDGLVHSSEGLLSVPLLPRQELHKHMEKSWRTEGTPAGSARKTALTHLHLGSFTGIHLIQELHF